MANENLRVLGNEAQIVMANAIALLLGYNLVAKRALALMIAPDTSLSPVTALMRT